MRVRSGHIQGNLALRVCEPLCGECAVQRQILSPGGYQGEGISVPRMRAEMGPPWSVALLRHAEAGQPVLHRRTGLGAIPLLCSQDVSQKGAAGNVCSRTAEIPACAQPRMGSERQDYQIRQQKHKLRPEGQRFFTPFSCCFRIMLCEIYTRKICASSIGIFSKKSKKNLQQ